MSIMTVREMPEFGVEQGSMTNMALDPGIRNLLDHIAVELAEEYIRLMDAAAHSESVTRSDRFAPPP
jgi:hypothetical protein